MGTNDRFWVVLAGRTALVSDTVTRILVLYEVPSPELPARSGCRAKTFHRHGLGQGRAGWDKS
jgi:hypothetical protein